MRTNGCGLLRAEDWRISKMGGGGFKKEEVVEKFNLETDLRDFVVKQ
jgi:hypothetical protein